MRTHQLKIQWKFEMYEIITSVIQNNLKEMKQTKNFNIVRFKTPKRKSKRFWKQNSDTTT